MRQTIGGKFEFSNAGITVSHNGKMHEYLPETLDDINSFILDSDKLAGKDVNVRIDGVAPSCGS